MCEVFCLKYFHYLALATILKCIKIFVNAVSLKFLPSLKHTRHCNASVSIAFELWIFIFKTHADGKMEQIFALGAWSYCEICMSWPKNQSYKICPEVTRHSL